jgi:replicative DNA helicase
MAERTPICDIEAEQAVLSAIVLAPECLDDVRDVVNVEDFYDPRFRLMFQACLDLDAAGAKVDEIAVHTRLRAIDRSEQAGGAAAIAAMVDATPAVANVLEHAKIVADLSRQRRFTMVAQRIVAEGSAFLREPVHDWMKRAEADIASVAETGQPKDAPENLEVVAKAVVDDVHARMARKDGDTMIGRPCGLWALDKKLSGWETGLYVIAGRPGMGKSALAMAILRGYAERNQNRLAVFISLEMPKSQLAARALSADAMVPFTAIREGRLSPQNMSDIVAAVGRIARIPVSLAFRPGATVRDVRSVVRRALRDQRKKHGDQLELGMVAVDYIQLMKGLQGNGREVEVGSISRELKMLSGEIDAPVLGLSQLNRGVESRDEKRPKMSDLRESGAIEQDADAILFAYRDEYYNPKTAREGVAEIIIGKQRNGATGTIELGFRGEYVRFDPIVEAAGYSDFDDRYDGPG